MNKKLRDKPNFFNYLMAKKQGIIKSDSNAEG